MTESTDRENEMLDGAFAALRNAPPAMPDGLLARIEADARQVQDGFASPPAASSGPKLQWFAWVGGWRGASGLVAATVAGLAIGLAQPGVLSTGLLVAGDEVSLLETDTFADFETALVEGYTDG